MKVLDVTNEEIVIAAKGAIDDALLAETEAWVSLQESKLDYLIAQACPELLPLSFTREGLDVAVQWLLQDVPARKAATSGPGGEKLALVARYWGEYLVTNFEGEWVLAVAEGARISTNPLVLLPYGRPLYDVFRNALSCVTTRENRLLNLAQYVDDAFTAWKASGQPRVLSQDT